MSAPNSYANAINPAVIRVRNGVGVGLSLSGCDLRIGLDRNVINRSRLRHTSGIISSKFKGLTMNKQNDKMTDSEFKTAVMVIGAATVGFAVLPVLTLGLVVGGWFVRLK